MAWNGINYEANHWEGCDGIGRVGGGGGGSGRGQSVYLISFLLMQRNDCIIRAKIVLCQNAVLMNATEKWHCAVQREKAALAAEAAAAAAVTATRSLSHLPSSYSSPSSSSPPWSCQMTVAHMNLSAADGVAHPLTSRPSSSVPNRARRGHGMTAPSPLCGLRPVRT